MLVDRARHAPQPRVVARMVRLQIEHRIGAAHGATAQDELVGRRAQLLQPFIRYDFRQQDEAIGEIAFPLLPAEDARRYRKYLFGCHRSLLESHEEDARANMVLIY